MQQGTRKRPLGRADDAGLEKMSADDILNVTAYVSSLPVGSKQH